VGCGHTKARQGGIVLNERKTHAPGATDASPVTEPGRARLPGGKVLGLQLLHAWVATARTCA
jgi:hypothetical protein